MKPYTAFFPALWFAVATTAVWAAEPAASTLADPAQSASVPPAFHAVASTPPMGRNSYDAFGDSVAEAEVLANAVYPLGAAVLLRLTPDRAK